MLMKSIKNYEKRIFWLKVNVSNNHKIIISYHALFFLNAIKFLMFYIKNSSF